jgi:uncharacterized protein YutE (UPF0331/DUF86 family)
MKEERAVRYKDKIDYIVSSLEAIPEEPAGDLEIRGVFYSLHTAVEAAMDLVAMLLKDTGKKIEDDYTNIEVLEEAGIITEQLAENLKKCNGLRNYLVHRYDKLNDKIALDSVVEVKKNLYDFIEVVENFSK